METNPLEIGGFGALRDRLAAPQGCIETPRLDAKKFRTRDNLAVPRECIVEMYELLWRWGDGLDGSGRKNFQRRFGFALPNTVVIAHGKPTAWYFTSQKDGSLLRKTPKKLSCATVEQEFLKRTGSQEIVAQWIPMASQFESDRSSSSNVEFLNRSDFSTFMSRLFQYQFGVLQEFVIPHGISNSVIRTMEFQEKISIAVRYNRLLLNSSTSLFKKCATFEGWPGLSSVQYKFNPAVSVTSKFQGEDMDKNMREMTQRLEARVCQERVRQMHFLQPTQYIAFHFKLDQNFVHQFLFASIIDEDEAFEQSQSQLVLEDPVMKEPLVRPSIEREPPPPRDVEGETPRETNEEIQAAEYHVASTLDGPCSVEPPRPRRPKLPAPEPKPSFIPKTEFQMPIVPPVPYSANIVPHMNEEAGRFEYPPPFVTPGNVKQPLITWS